MKESLEGEEGVSPVIGVILLVAITVIIAAVLAVFVLGIGEDLGTGGGQAGVTVEDGTITLVDSGSSDKIVVRDSSGNDVGNLSSVGENVKNLGGGTYDIIGVKNGKETVLRTITVPSSIVIYEDWSPDPNDASWGSYTNGSNTYNTDAFDSDTSGDSWLDIYTTSSQGIAFRSNKNYPGKNDTVSFSFKGGDNAAFIGFSGLILGRSGKYSNVIVYVKEESGLYSHNAVTVANDGSPDTSNSYKLPNHLTEGDEITIEATISGDNEVTFDKVCFNSNCSLTEVGSMSSVTLTNASDNNIGIVSRAYTNTANFSVSEVKSG